MPRSETRKKTSYKKKPIDPFDREPLHQKIPLRVLLHATPWQPRPRRPQRTRHTPSNDAADGSVLLVGLDADAAPAVAEGGAVPDRVFPGVLPAVVVAPGEVVFASALPVVHLGERRKWVGGGEGSERSEEGEYSKLLRILMARSCIRSIRSVKSKKWSTSSIREPTKIILTVLLSKQ